MDKLSELYAKGVSRRNFLAGAGALGAASVLAGCSNDGTPTPTSTPTMTPTPTPTPNPSFTDNDILNFALNLEYLEAEFYLRAATGQGLPASLTGGTGTAGTVTAPATTQLTGLTPTQQKILNEIAYDEQQHVVDLRGVLGVNAVARPAIDLTFFGPLAVAAGITTATSPAFTPFDNFNDFLIGAFIFEDVGVTAYHGAAGLISQAGLSNGTLADAAGILAVEAYHAAYVRTAITGTDIMMGAPTLIPIANKVSALRAMLGGGNETPLTFPTPVTGNGTAAFTTPPSSIVAADATNAIAFARTPDQVHHIVYGSATVGAKSGGFFPAGTNSVFSVTTT